MLASNPSCKLESRLGTNYVARVTISLLGGEQLVSVVLQIASASDQPQVWNSTTCTLQADGTYATSAGYPPPGATPPYVYRFAITYVAVGGQTLTSYYPNPPAQVGGP